ncbi:MAG: 30S ribosomal protein S8 [Fuerstiella sp.]|nr:30S ribosomal protein S8 [Fuerstiella sp.]
MMTDPIADFLTRIRNAVRVERPFVDMPLSKMKMRLAEVLHREGYVWDSEVIEGEPVSTLRINLKYGPNGEHLIEHIERLSKPGRRVYVGVRELREVRQGTGISVLSTPKGLLSNREARQQSVGGELLCQLW